MSSLYSLSNKQDNIIAILEIHELFPLISSHTEVNPTERGKMFAVIKLDYSPHVGISVQIKTEITLSSPYGRGAAVFEAGAENYGCGEEAIL